MPALNNRPTPQQEFLALQMEMERRKLKAAGEDASLSPTAPVETKRGQPRPALREFVRGAWNVVEPSARYLHNWHIDAISEHLEACAKREIKRLVVNVQPRSMKSLLTSVFFPTWVWTGAPGERFMTCSHSASLSVKHSTDRRTLIRSDWYQSQWGDVFQMSADVDTKMEYSNSAMGTMYSTSVGASPIGRGGNFLILDDLHNPDEAKTAAAIQVGVDFFKSTLYSRLNNKKEDVIICISQRLHESDVSGYLVDEFKEQEFTVLKLPTVCESEADRYVSLPSGMVYEREIGELLWPEREGPEEVAGLRNVLGAYGFAAQCQQEPAPVGGGIIQDSWWRFYRRAELPERFETQIAAWDMTFKDTSTSDYVCGVVLGRTGANIYVLDAAHDRMSFTRSLFEVQRLLSKWPRVKQVYIEQAANGFAIIETLKHKIPGIVPIPPEGSKEARLHSVSWMIEAGNVWLPHPDECRWVGDLMYEFAKFPKAKKDDWVDALVHGLSKIGGRTRSRIFAAV